MQSYPQMSEQELLIQGVVMREALVRILSRHNQVSSVDGVDTGICVRSLSNARLDIGLPPFSGASLPACLAPALAQALADAPRTDRDFKILLSALETLLSSCLLYTSPSPRDS